MYSRWGGPEQLRWVHASNTAAPPLAPRSVRISVRWSGVNPADGKILSGRYRLLCKGGFPRGIGAEGSGHVEAVGAQVVNGLKPGMRVVFGLDILDGRQGAWADSVDVPAERVMALPDDVTMRDAAGLPVAALTAWLMCEMARLQPGMTVLVTGAAGGVGSFAVQLARLRGAIVTATGSAPRRAMVEALGAHDFIDYREHALESSGRRWQAVLDCVNSVSRAQSARLLAPTGCYIDTEPQPLTMFTDLWRSLGSGRRWRTVRVDMHRDGMAQLLSHLATGRLRTVVSHVWPMAEATTALRASMTGRATGKLLLRGQGADALRHAGPATAPRPTPIPPVGTTDLPAFPPTFNNDED